ncbi:hypothetical protein SAMN05720606_11311 [Paenibacillus polysaccharolyticus]|uniref:YesK-like protein n=1 Tax=Paenibacillus polysaccharolyticus TaxID=582692 RepID=A0A1G5K3Y6_9BACL|nr:hypothetical protein SAMN05720606_11311 [Paenibacillus polysaccharolyticus]
MTITTLIILAVIVFVLFFLVTIRLVTSLNPLYVCLLGIQLTLLGILLIMIRENINEESTLLLLSSLFLGVVGTAILTAAVIKFKS